MNKTYVLEGPCRLALFLSLFCDLCSRGPPRPRPAPAVGEAEDKENQQAANGPNQPSVRRGYRRPYNYRRRPRPPNAPSQDGKEVNAASRRGWCRIILNHVKRQHSILRVVL